MTSEPVSPPPAEVVESLRENLARYPEVAAAKDEAKPLMRLWELVQTLRVKLLRHPDPHDDLITDEVHATHEEIKTLLRRRPELAVVFPFDPRIIITDKDTDRLEDWLKKQTEPMNQRINAAKEFITLVEDIRKRVPGVAKLAKKAGDDPAPLLLFAKDLDDRFWHAARAVVENVWAGLEAEPPAKKGKKKGKRGRPVDSDLNKDAKVFDGWSTHEYIGYESLGSAFGLSAKEAERTIDRERKRRKRNEAPDK